MSINGYKLKEIKHAECPTFSLSNEEINEWLCDIGAFTTLDLNGCGLVDIPRKTIEMELEDRPEQRFGPESIAILREMLADCGEEDFITYYCF